MEHQNNVEIDDQNDKDDDDLSISEDRRRSSSSISSMSDIESAITDFSFEDSSQVDKHEHVDEQDETLESQAGDESALESPPVQVMERPAESSGYRIPSHVFARDKSSNPEWSMCSNESLFSIHTGNMSFTRDQFNWLLKSGELGIHGAGDIRKSGELPPPSPRNAPSLEQKKGDLSIDDQVPVSTKETLKPGEDVLANEFNTIPLSPPPDKEEDHFQGTNTLQTNQVDLVRMKKDDTDLDQMKDKISSVTSDESRLSKCVSHHSDASFAFPVLAEIGRDKSINSGNSQTHGENQKNSMVDDKETTQTPPKATTEATVASSWFPSYFSWCCSCCC